MSFDCGVLLDGVIYLKLFGTEWGLLRKRFKRFKVKESEIFLQAFT